MGAGQPQQVDFFANVGRWITPVMDYGNGYYARWLLLEKEDLEVELEAGYIIGGVPSVQIDKPSPACRYQHTVQRGEGLFAIGAKYGVSPADMLKANPWVKRQYYWHLYVGQQVCVP